MPPYFETVKSFADVSISESGVETKGFLEASDGLVQLFDLLGTGVFTFVQSDLKMNIHGIRTRYEAHQVDSATLELLAEDESREAHRVAIPCLVRLTRGLAFTCNALLNMQQDRKSDLHSCFKRAYDQVLRSHHSVFVRSLVSVALHAVPRRDDFYRKIAQGGSTDKLDAELKKWLEGLDRIVKHMTVFLAQGGYGTV